MSETMHSTKRSMLLLGDSIAAGLGVSEGSYGSIVARELDLSFIDLSASARTIVESERLLSTRSDTYDFAVIAHGITEPILRPSEGSLRLVPQRWRRPGWLDPRPYFSRRLLRRCAQRAESSLRWRVKKLLLHLGTPAQMVNVVEYRDAMRRISDSLTKRGTRVIVLGPPDLDGRYFPGSAEQQKLYAQEVENLNVTYLPLWGELEKWGSFFADNFHPNQRGHQRIATLVIEHINQLSTDIGPRVEPTSVE